MPEHLVIDWEYRTYRKVGLFERRLKVPRKSIGATYYTDKSGLIYKIVIKVGKPLPHEDDDFYELKLINAALIGWKCAYPLHVNYADLLYETITMNWSDYANQGTIRP